MNARLCRFTNGPKNAALLDRWRTAKGSASPKSRSMAAARLGKPTRHSVPATVRTNAGSMKGCSTVTSSPQAAAIDARMAKRPRDRHQSSITPGPHQSGPSESRASARPRAAAAPGVSQGSGSTWRCVLRTRTARGAIVAATERTSLRCGRRRRVSSRASGCLPGSSSSSPPTPVTRDPPRACGTSSPPKWLFGGHSGPNRRSSGREIGRAHV